MSSDEGKMKTCKLLYGERMYTRIVMGLGQLQIVMRLPPPLYTHHKLYVHFKMIELRVSYKVISKTSMSLGHRISTAQIVKCLLLCPYTVN